jgi:hypothetical protein
MSKKKKGSNDLLIIAGLGVVGYYLYSQGYLASFGLSPVAATPVQPSSNATNTTGVPVSAVTTPVVSFSEPEPTPTSTLPSIPGTTPAQVLQVQQWVDSWMQPVDQVRFANMLGNMNSGDILGLIDMINSGGAQTQTQVDFWNNWRIKYGIDVG